MCNEKLVAEYTARYGSREFETFVGWKMKNRKVKKGEKGNLVWSRPSNVLKDEPTEKPRFFKAYLFHISQTEAIQEKIKA